MADLLTIQRMTKGHKYMSRIMTMSFAPSKDSDQPGQPPILIRVFAVRMKKAWVLSYPMSAQRSLWSDWADAQAYLSLRWVHSHFASFVMSCLNWAASSEFVSSSIPSWQILTAHAQPFRGARDLAFCLKVPLDSLLVWASSGVLARLHGYTGSPEPSLLA